MGNYLQIKDGICINVIIVDDSNEEFKKLLISNGLADELISAEKIEPVNGVAPWIGWSYDGKGFTPPVEEVVKTPEEKIAEGIPMTTEELQKVVKSLVDANPV